MNNISATDLKIIEKIFEGRFSAGDISKSLGISESTVRNAGVRNDLFYSKKNKTYFFSGFVPKILSPKTIIDILSKEIENNNMGDIFTNIIQEYFEIKNVIDVRDLPKEIQLIIMLEYAINVQIELRIVYEGKEITITPQAYGYFDGNRILMANNKLFNVAKIESIIPTMELSNSYPKQNFIFNQFGEKALKDKVAIRIKKELANYFDPFNHPKHLFFEIIEKYENGTMTINLFCTTQELIIFYIKFAQYIDILDANVKSNILSEIKNMAKDI